MRPQLRRLLESAGFSPRQLFAALQGAWLEPTPGYIWQENTGVTPTTTGGQTIGLLLDQSQGAVLGPELVSNGTFDTNTNSWSLRAGSDPVTGGQLTWVNGRAQFTRGTTFPSAGASQLISGLVVGRLYRFSGVIRRVNGASGVSIDIRTGDGGGGSSLASVNTSSSSSVLLSAVWAATQTSIHLTMGCLSGETIECDDVSFREILGNHAYQSVSGSRPTYQLDSNGLPLARHDATDSLSVSLPNLGGGVFSASGSVYFATPVGMSALHNQSMGTTYQLPALSTDIYSWIVVPQRLNTAQESRLARYMERKAGIAGPDYFDQADNGPELVVNGGFDSDTAWTKGVDWSISGGVATKANPATSADISQVITTKIGTIYMLQFTLSGLGGGTNIAKFVYNGTYGSDIKTNGTHILYITANRTSNEVGVRMFLSSGSIDNFSVRELKDGMTGQLTDDSGNELLLAQ